MRVKVFALLAVSLFVAGCAGPRSHYLLAQTATAVPQHDILSTHQIFVATTRNKAATEPRQVFDGNRSLTTSFAKVDMTVPRAHKVGNIERPRGSASSDPAEHFTASSVTFFDEASHFAAAASRDIESRDERILVFVHGFNNGFDDGIYRITQIVQDTKYAGTPVLFSWASSGKTSGYIYDKESANAARDDLEATLRMLAKTKAKSIDIIAHSMGTWVTMEALRQLAITGDRDLSDKLGHVVLASPDIDVDVFKKQMLRYGKPDKPFAILLSDDDRALKLSSLISGDKPRVGDYGDAADLASYGVIVVDLTQAKSANSLNHAKFADNPILVQLLGNSLQTPAALASPDPDFDQPVSNLGRGIGQAVGSVADIVITTPFKVLNVVVQGE